MNTRISGNIVKRIKLEEAEKLWKKLLIKNPGVHPFSSYEWFKAWVEIRGTDSEPYIIASDYAIAPFLKKDQALSIYAAGTDYVDLIGDTQEWLRILKFIKQDGIHQLTLEKIPHDSGTLSFFYEYARKNPGRVEIENNATSPTLVLPHTFDEYLFSPTLKEKRRKYRKFMKENPDIEIINSYKTNVLLDDLISLMKTMDLKKDHVNSIRERFFREIAKTCSDYIWIMAVKINGIVAGAQMLFESNSQSMIYISGFEKEKYPNIGTFLIISAINESIVKQNRTFNFLTGKEPYKYEFGAQDFPLYKIICQL